MQQYLFSEYLRKSINEQHLSIKSTAERAGISRQNLHKILNGDISQAKLTTFIQLAHALNEHPLHLFRAYFNRAEFPSAVTQKQTVSYYQDDNTGFIGDITYPDYSLVKIGEAFEKQWKVQNMGLLVWEDRKMTCLDEQLSVHSMIDGSDTVSGLTPESKCLPAPRIEPGEYWTISIKFTAPRHPGTVISHWKMVDSLGNYCFPKSQPLTCLVKVVDL